MRTIDADVLMADLEKWLKQIDPIHPPEDNSIPPMEDIIVSTLMTIEEQPTIEPQRWIPVSEALPDRYIVGGDGKHYSLDVLMTVIYRSDDDIFIDYGQMVDDEWYSEMDNEIITSPFEVIAWMPLPEPYKGGEHGNNT